MTLDELKAAWRANNAINLEVLDGVSDSDLELKPGKGKTIRSNFVHMIGVRRTWCEEKLRKEAAEIEKLDWKTAPRDLLRSGLLKSSAVMELLFDKMEASAKPGRWTTPMFFAYAVGARGASPLSDRNRASSERPRAGRRLALRLVGVEQEGLRRCDYRGNGNRDGGATRPAAAGPKPQ